MATTCGVITWQCTHMLNYNAVNLKSIKKNIQSFFFHSRSEVKIKVTARPYSLLTLLAFGGSRCSLVCGCITPSPSFIFTWPSSLLQSSSLLSQTPLCLSRQGTLVIGFRDHPDNLRWSHLNILNLQRSFFQIKYYSITGSKIWHLLEGYF